MAGRNFFPPSHSFSPLRNAPLAPQRCLPLHVGNPHASPRGAGHYCSVYVLHWLSTPNLDKPQPHHKDLFPLVPGVGPLLRYRVRVLQGTGGADVASSEDHATRNGGRGHRCLRAPLVHPPRPGGLDRATYDAIVWLIKATERRVKKERSRERLYNCFANAIGILHCLRIYLLDASDRSGWVVQAALAVIDVKIHGTLVVVARVHAGLQ